MQYKIEFFTYWHTGSGLAAGTAANATVLRNAQDLPYISGKTLKGLLREAAEKINAFAKDNDSTKELVTTDFIEEVFGTRGSNSDSTTPVEHKTGDDSIKPGVCFFSNATLSQHLEQTLFTQKNQSLLYDTIHSTAIDDNGLAKRNALRSLEVTVPLTLFAHIEDLPAKEGYLQQMEYCMQWVKRMGVNRNRGLGRCRWTIVK